MRFLKKVVSILFSRLFLVGLMLALQLFLVFAWVVYFSQSFVYVYFLFVALSIITVVGVVSNNENPSYKITWIVAILFFPSIGWLFYLLFGHKRMPKKLQQQIDASFEDTRRHMPDDKACCALLRQQNDHLATQSRYISNISGYPLFPDTHTEYFPVGERMFERMIEVLREAKHYIFLEFFIIRPGRMWDVIFAILKEKAAEGVEVRLMYDDIGSISTFPRRINREITAAGIKLHVFNPFRPRVSVILNHRDHRKLTVIDGRIAFCGGINLADEYINEYERFGHWKDTGVLLEGEAAWAFSFMFLQQWQFSTGEPVDFGRYRRAGAAIPSSPRSSAMIQPFGDSPLDSFNVTEVAYLQIISRATDYVYISTPYLVIDKEMEVALCSAAQSGVDVRIITPFHYDKWYVHILTRSHYSQLIKAGVKIYEYTPGFIHGKMFVSDDDICMVGTCNMDFRSFYLHFECSVVGYQSGLVAEVKKDLLDSQAVSHQVSLEEAQSAPLHIRFARAILKLFAPLL